MAEEEKKPGETINLKVMTQDGNEIFFKCKLTTPLNKLMKAFCERQGVSMNTVRFLFDGNRINQEQTPQQACARPRASAQPARACARPHARAIASASQRRPCRPQLDMEDGDVIDVMVEQQGGCF